MTHARASRLLAAATVLLLSACGITTDDSPRDLTVTPANDVTGTDARTVITATTTSFIYFVSGSDDPDAPDLQSVPRDVPESAESVLRSLFAGPTAREANAGFTTAIPSNVKLISVTLAGDLATVNVTAGLSELSDDALVVAVGQIVLTATDVVGIGSVTVQEAGVAMILPDASGAPHVEPLERADVEPLKSDSSASITVPASVP